eukprot:TRINITY_DN15172_c0_g1_i1.p1 TRINITY_DN15172_c0_g1~~TRINITY_DN15172_c0_g1_i1.p1  ORF type:complete len:281 (+),score=54.94 TRINITY_DN15172_c0_g1_i1:10-852(+)
MEQVEVSFKVVGLPSFEGYKKILVVGLGGGCDVISAYVFAKTLLRASPGAVVIVADTKESAVGGIQPLTRSDGTPFSTVFVVPPTSPFKDTPHHLRYYALAMTLPKDEWNSPWVFLLKDHEEALKKEISSLGFDLIIGLDAGGDSLVEEAESGVDGKDKRMLKLLKSTGVPLVHIILGFGSDGESTEEEIMKALKIATLNGSYKGMIDLDGMVPLFRSHCSGWLANTRTPMIISNAIEGTKLDRRAGNKVRLDRGRNPIIPILWLQKGFVFDDTNLFTWN